jgi:shikimate dehydrogenase
MPVAHRDLYAVIGHPVAHSQSPFIHAEFARQTGQVMSFERRLCPLDGFAAALERFAAEGGHGCSITVPFKFEAGDVARHLSPRAQLARAANALRLDEDGWRAENTDGAGLVRDIESNAGVALAGRRVLLVGAGGAGAGVLGPIVEAGPAEVTVVNRTPAKAEALLERHAAWARDHGVALRGASMREPGAGFDVVVNATASSLQGGEPPVPAAALRPGCLVIDLMYGPPAAAFLHWAASQGAVPRDGLGMLVEQAAVAFACWRGVMPQTAAVLAALRQRLAANSAEGCR